MLHHDVEEGIQSVLEKLDKGRKVAFRKMAGGQEIPHLSIFSREPEPCSRAPGQLQSQEPELSHLHLGYCHGGMSTSKLKATYLYHFLSIHNLQLFQILLQQLGSHTPLQQT
jgi:hypothetical protein